MKLTRIVLAIVALLAVPPPGATAASSIVLYPVSDTSGEDSNSDGVFETLFSDTNSYFYADRGDYGPGRRWAALECDISGIPPSSVIQSATLYLSGNRVHQYVSLSLYGYVGDGVVTLSELSAGDFLTSVTINNIGSSFYFTYNVASHLTNLLAAQHSFAGFRISAGCGIYTSCGARFAAYSPGGTVPRMEIQYVVRPTITSIAMAATNGLIRFESQVGYRYTLDQAPVLGTWTPAQTNILGTGAVLDVAVSRDASDRQMFYRLEVEP